MDQLTKPPLGLVPQFLVKCKRARDIKAAVLRYLRADMPIPAEWVEEYNDLAVWLNRNAPENSRNQ